MENVFLEQLDFTLLCRLWKEHKELFQMVDFKDGKHAIIKFDQSTIKRLSAVSAENSAVLEMPHVTDCGNGEPEIVIDEGDKEIRLYRTRIDEHKQLEGNVSYSVVKYDTNAGGQEVIGEGLSLDEASDIARGASDGDSGNIYIVVMKKNYVVKYTELVPFKAYENGEVGGAAWMRREE